jgi:hypothetical protein
MNTTTRAITICKAGKPSDKTLPKIKGGSKSKLIHQIELHITEKLQRNLYNNFKGNLTIVVINL